MFSAVAWSSPKRRCSGAADGVAGVGVVISSLTVLRVDSISLW
jgi:hypothetical protein